MYGETFYGRHTAQHQLQRRQIKIQEVRSFKSSEHIRKEVDGPYFEEEKCCCVCEFQISSRFKDWYISKWVPNR